MLERMSGMRIVASGVALLVAAGCGGDGGGEAGGDGGAEQQAEQVEFPVDEANAGSISATVNFEGTAPEPEAIDMSSEAQCADQHDSQPMTQHVVVNENGTLSNVYVHVSEGVDESLQFPTPQEAVTLDQVGCRYTPHVLGLQTGQTLQIENSDGFLHNINAQPSQNRGFNISQPVEMSSTRTFPMAEVMIPLTCDVHGWMNAYVGVKDNPYFGVTGGEGTVSIDRLPPGEYTVEAWHEEYGTTTQTVTVETGATAEVSFTFSSDMAGAHVPLGEPVDLHDHATTTMTDGP